MVNQGPMTEATYYILLALMKPGHGCRMMQRIRELSNGRINMGPGTLHGVLTRMKKEVLIHHDRRIRTAEKLPHNGKLSIFSVLVKAAALPNCILTPLNRLHQLKTCEIVVEGNLRVLYSFLAYILMDCLSTIHVQNG